MCRWQEPTLEPSYQEAVDLARLALRFGEVDRLTRHPDGIKLESDPTHTIMLSLIACSLASKYLPHLNTGLLAQLSLVHDLPEAYAGDTPTLRITTEEREAKHVRELAAIDRIWNEFWRTPWLSFNIQHYEAKSTPEARFVYALDKCLPKLTHLLNRGAVLALEGASKEELTLTYKAQAESLAPYFDEFPILGRLYNSLAEAVLGMEDW